MSGETVQKNCAACGTLITVRLADHKRGWGRFCDKVCAGAYKFGQRPRDVNAHHAKTSSWAAACLNTRDLTKAPPIKDQVGNVKVKPIYHSPAHCRECGADINGPGLCERCDEHLEGLAACEAGWDGHKVWTA
jgi:hypothetical protein